MSHHLYLVEKTKSHATPIHLVFEKNYDTWLKRQPDLVRNWLISTHYKPKAGNYALLPASSGAIAHVLCCIADPLNIWSIAHLATALPPHTYAIDAKLSPAQANAVALGWALASYEFTRYKKSKNVATLVAPANVDMEYVRSMHMATNWARDMINCPANDMDPVTLAKEASSWASSAGGKVRVLSGEQLIKNNFPMIYTVGKAATVPPQLVDIHFIRKGAPQVTLVGKGVTFDTGGLDIKSTSNMKMMKKDMGGAANVLALAKVIIDTGLPISLRVLLPIVENSIAGNAMRPLDIANTRKGITVEIGNTDAEGRLILCDALTAACEESPELIIDCATLTGAARVALGTDIPAFFTHSDTLAKLIAKHSEAEMDPLWRLPLWNGYRSMLDTANADLSNDPDSGYGGAITAALYLNEFVSKNIAWLHIDMMAWNLKSRPGRPVGGEAMGIRALYAFLKERYGNG